MLERVAAIGGCQWAAVQARITPPRIMPKILYLVTEDWFFVSHFLPMAQARGIVCRSSSRRPCARTASGSRRKDFP